MGFDLYAGWDERQLVRGVSENGSFERRLTLNELRAKLDEPSPQAIISQSTQIGEFPWRC
jgi:hypothetical protein